MYDDPSLMRLRSICSNPLTCQWHIAQAQLRRNLRIIHRILLSVYTLTDSLRSYLGVLFSFGFRYNIHRSQERGLRPDLFSVALRGFEWCRFQARRMEVDFQVKLFRTSTCKTKHLESARQSEEGCSRLAASKQKISPDHTNTACLGETIEVPDCTIENIARNGLVALLTFNERSGGERELKIQGISIQPLNIGVPYIVFSHVRIG